MKILEIKNLSKKFNHQSVLQHINFSLEENESLVIIGTSGAGKSVLLRCILGLLPKDTGQIYYYGDAIDGIVTQPEISYGVLFQSNALFDDLKVWENIAFFWHFHEKRSKAEIYPKVLEMLDLVELDKSVAEKYPPEISGGMKKRVALARCLIQRPKLLFFDEPTEGLDPVSSANVSQVIKKGIKAMGASAITITHDMTSLKVLATKVAFLYKGTIAWYGDVAELHKVNLPVLQEFVG